MIGNISSFWHTLEPSVEKINTHWGKRKGTCSSKTPISKPNDQWSFSDGLVVCSWANQFPSLNRVTFGKSFYHCEPLLYQLNGDKLEIISASYRVAGQLKWHHKKCEKLILIIDYLTQYIPNNIISTCNQFKLLMGYLTLSFSYLSFFFFFNFLIEI